MGHQWGKDVTFSNQKEKSAGSFTLALLGSVNIKCLSEAGPYESFDLTIMFSSKHLWAVRECSSKYSVLIQEEMPLSISFYFLLPLQINWNIIEG